MDFDKSFAAYVNARMKKESLSIQDVEEVISKFSDDWANTPIVELGGKSPTEYFAGEADPVALIGILCDLSDKGSILPMLFDRIVELKSTTSHLLEILNGKHTETQRIAAVKLLSIKNEIDCAVFVRLIVDQTVKGELKEEIVTSLIDIADKAKESVLDALKTSGDDDKKLLCEILSYCAPDERVYAALVDCFITADDISFGASLLARYGDFRATEIMKEYAKHCEYSDYIELRNGVERLGGDLDVPRDWDEE